MAQQQNHSHDHHRHKDHDHAEALHAKPAPGCCAHGQACAASAASAAAQTSAAPGRAERGGSRFRIPDMDCAAEEAEIRHALKDVPGLRGLHFQLAARTLSIDAPQAAMAAALEALQGAGFAAQPLVQETPPERMARWLAPGVPRYALALLLALAAELVHGLAATPSLPVTVLGMVLALGAIALAGLDTYRKGLAALRRARFNINAVMAVAVTGAFLIGQWPEAAMVMALYAIAELLEARSVDRARNAIQALLALAPETVELRQADGSWQEQPVASAAVGAYLRVKPGARVPLDARVTAGTSAVDQAALTGESMPVDKAEGDPLFAGTINLSGTLQAQVTAPAGDSLLARIIHAVEQAQSARAPTQQWVDRLARVYTPAVFALAVALALLAPVALGWTWTQALYQALVLLVIACPCALVISTPVTLVSALAAAARRGILIKGGVYLEGARRIRVVALDKTGTLTQGLPRLVAQECVASDLAAAPQILHWAADLAAHSDHPVAQAIARGLDAHRCGEELEHFQALAGRGVAAQAHGMALVLGNRRWIEERGLCSPAVEARLAQHEAQGRSVTLLAAPTQVLAIFAVADALKDGTPAAIARLHALGVATAMLTGDNWSTAQAVAALAGIDDVRANLLPEDKLQAIAALRQRHGMVAMVGDGINDAPALAGADIGFAMGAVGTDIALETADVVVMNDDLERVAETIQLSRRTQVVLWQNIALALGIKVVFLLLALGGQATMWMAVFADMGASLIVVANGLRLARAR